MRYHTSKHYPFEWRFGIDIAKAHLSENSFAFSRVIPRDAFYSGLPLFVGNQALPEFDPAVCGLNELVSCHHTQSLELGELDTFSSRSTLRVLITIMINVTFQRSQGPSSAIPTSEMN
jgi:hypothetical protein